MESVLNLGLKFAILPPKLDVIQVLTDFRRFERSMMWNEFWFARETENHMKNHCFRKRNTTFLKIIDCQMTKDLKEIIYQHVGYARNK